MRPIQVRWHSPRRLGHFGPRRRPQVQPVAIARVRAHLSYVTVPIAILVIHNLRLRSNPSRLLRLLGPVQKQSLDLGIGMFSFSLAVRLTKSVSSLITHSDNQLSF